MRKDKLLLPLALCFVGIVGFLIFTYTLSTKESTQKIAPAVAETVEVEKNSESLNTPLTEQTVVVDKVEETESNTSGIHIMPDGTVMAKDGTVLADATILANGTVQLGDGTIITPAADLRSSADSSIVASDAPSHVVIDVVGIDFEYDIKQIKVKKGDTVTINFKSDKGFHDWVVDEFDAATERVNEGGTTSVTFVADKVGMFQYYCSVMSHRQMGMVGYLIVEEN